MTLRTLKTSSSTLKDRLLSRYRILNKDTEEIVEKVIWDYVLERKPIKVKEITETIGIQSGEEINDCLVNFLINSMYKDGLLLGYGKENNDFLPKTTFKAKVYKKFDGQIRVPSTRLALIGLKIHDRCTISQQSEEIFKIDRYNNQLFNYTDPVTTSLLNRSGISFYPNDLPFYNSTYENYTKYSISLEKNKTLLITMEN